MRKIYWACRNAFAISAMYLLLAGCEAPLDMYGVEATQKTPIHRTDRFQSIARNENNLVVVGNQGVIVRSADNGESWQRVELADWPALIDVTACPNGDFVALAFAPLVYVSSDGGASWAARPIASSENPQALTCTADNTIWVVGAFTNRWTSTDAGQTWTEATDDEDALLTTVQFFDADRGIITGEFGTVMSTSDGGETWDKMPALVDEFYPQASYFKDPMTGWIVGLGGVILRTSDGGETWISEATETVVPLYGIEQVGDSVFAVGGEGTLLKYDGTGWRLVEHGKPIRLYIRAIKALDETHAIIAGVGGALHIIDTSGA
ncbi:MAG: YCF48-related protein [Proteobacteria bacterium]|nr:YCF48-related protein [Pseudomonadota bacterium]